MKTSKVTGETSDGYHTFNELYEHRSALWMALCKSYFYRYCQIADHDKVNPVWRSKKHSDGSSYNGWFILGIFKKPGQQMTYHLPMNKWDACDFADILDMAPEYDGHTSNDVVERISRL